VYQQFVNMEKQIHDRLCQYINEIHIPQFSVFSFNTKITTIMNRCAPHHLTTSRYSLPWFGNDLKKIYKRSDNYNYNKAKGTRNPGDWQEFSMSRIKMHKHL